jgi:hypothetical protein
MSALGQKRTLIAKDNRHYAAGGVSEAASPSRIFDQRENVAIEVFEVREQTTPCLAF